MAGGIQVLSDDQTMERMDMLKAFDETKSGVKGLLDSGLDKIPKIFVRPSAELSQDLTYKTTQIQVPVIDLSGIHDDPDRRNQVIEQVKSASETWGFFQVVNHGIPSTVLDGMIEGVREFNEGDIEEKKKYYSRDAGKSVKFSSNYDLYVSRTANWRDSLRMSFPDQIDGEELPVSCRESTVEYSKHVRILGNSLLELFSEALGLEPDCLKNLECSKGVRMSCHYYPGCPEPELTLGATKHTDPTFVTILLTNQIKGLQVMLQDQWIDVVPDPGALIVNIGDFLQLVSNGKFMSSMHRVTANSIGPRISVAYFLSGPIERNKGYGPIEELISEENPAVYGEVLLRDYIMKFFYSGLDGYVVLDNYKF